MAPRYYNASSPGIPYFTPEHQISPGTAHKTANNVPTLFKPLPIRAVTLRNRIIVAPMCQYSCAEVGPQIGALTPYHVVTLGHYALKGAALVFIEATGVQPNGRISPNCPGLWSDSQIDGVKAVADFIHSQGGLCGMQLAHAGRKASTVATYVAGREAGTARGGKINVRATKELGGWPEDVVGPSGGEEFTWDGKRSDDPEGGFYAPRELSVKEVKQLVQDFASAAARAVRAGVDVLEIHGAHGYLIHQFLSPISNQRTDAYGGSFENRTRIVIEIIDAIRAVIPATTPLFLRLSGTDWMDEHEVGKKFGSWQLEDTIRISKIIAAHGVDLLDVSSAGTHPGQKLDPFSFKDYQIRLAESIRKDIKSTGTNLLIGAVGLITEAEQARGIVEDPSLAKEAEVAKSIVQDAVANGEPMADVVLVARQFMREPEWVLKIAAQLNVDVAWPSQWGRVKFPKL